MDWLILALVLVILPFGLVVIFGAPYVPTKRRQIETALKLLDLKSGETLIELGVGDGRVALAAAQSGIKVIGYEINPWLVVLCRLRCLRYRRRVKIYWRDFWRVKLPPAEGLFVFGVSRIMARLEAKLSRELRSGTKVVSFAFDFPHREPGEQHVGLKLYKF